MPVSQRAILIPALVVAILSISSAAILIRMCDDAEPVVIAAARLGIATLVLTPALLFRKKTGPGVPRHLRKYIVLGGLFLGAHFFLWISSLRHTSVLSSVVLVTTNPIFVGIGSYLIFRERVGASLVVGILLAAAGGIIITFSGPTDAGSSVYGNFLSVAGAMMASGYLLVGRKVRREVDLLSYLVLVYGVGAIVLFGGVILQDAPLRGLRWQTYMYFVLLAVVPQILGHGVLNYALRHVSATLIAICILGEPIGASILAYLALGEVIDRWQAIGGAVILTGIYVASRRPADTRDMEESLP